MSDRKQVFAMLVLLIIVGITFVAVKRASNKEYQNMMAGWKAQAEAFDSQTTHLMPLACYRLVGPEINGERSHLADIIVYCDVPRGNVIYHRRNSNFQDIIVHQPEACLAK